MFIIQRLSYINIIIILNTIIIIIFKVIKINITLENG